MFCTNCGEEMRPTDKFCAECGTPSAPRSKRSRNAASAVPAIAAGSAESPTPADTPAPAWQRVPQSTAEVVPAPLPRMPSSTGRRRPAEIAPQAPVSQPPAAPAPARHVAPPSKPGAAPENFASSDPDEEQRILLEQEEIASARGLTPIEVLPDFPPPATHPTRTAAAQPCPACGRLNPADSRLCDACGAPLQSPRPAAAPATPTGWLYDSEPEPAIPAAAAASAPASLQATPPAAQQSDSSFFYYYNDKATTKGNRRMLIILLVVLALGIVGLVYLMTHSPSKPAVAGNVTVSITPTEAQVMVGEAHDFSATVSGSGETDINWSVDEGIAGGKVVSHGAQADGGVVVSKAVYIAPPTPGTYHIVATSKADPSKSASAEVLVSGK